MVSFDGRGLMRGGSPRVGVLVVSTLRISIMLFVWDEAKRRSNLRKHGIRKATKREAHFYFSQIID